MSTSTLSHRFGDGLVTMKVRRSDASTGTFTVTEREAKRFAWSLLADLDPDEVKASGGPAPASVSHGDQAAHGASKRLILEAIEGGAVTAADLAVRTGIPAKQISSRVVHLRTADLVKLVSGGSRGFPASYALTDAGRAHLAAVRA